MFAPQAQVTVKIDPEFPSKRGNYRTHEEYLVLGFSERSVLGSDPPHMETHVLLIDDQSRFRWEPMSNIIAVSQP